jgi:putative DNA primase/helicase
MSAIADRCRGKWSSILIGVGVGLTEAARKGRDAPCPICGGKDRFRFSNKDGLGLWYCHGCGEGGDGVKLVMKAKGLDFKSPAKLIDGALGHCNFYSPSDANGYSSGCATHAGGGDNRPKDVLRSWRDAYPDIRNTTVEAYLKGRGLTLTENEAKALRFHPALFHHPTKGKWPAMIAAVARADNTIITCHQTFLQIDGSGKAPVEKPKLFPSGVDPAGAAAWFGTPDPTYDFVVAEGIESALSAMRILGVQAGCAALSTWGIKRLVLPQPVRRVTVFADSDELQQGVAAANEARRRWQGEGRTVGVLQAEREGDDANDVWLRRLAGNAGVTPSS